MWYQFDYYYSDGFSVSTHQYIALYADGSAGYRSSTYAGFDSSMSTLGPGDGSGFYTSAAARGGWEDLGVWYASPEDELLIIDWADESYWLKDYYLGDGTMLLKQAWDQSSKKIWERQ